MVPFVRCLFPFDIYRIADRRQIIYINRAIHDINTYAHIPSSRPSKRFPWQCFRCLLPFSNPSVFYYRPLSLRRLALLPASRPVPACRFPFFVSSCVPSHPATSRPACLPVPSLPVFLAVRSPRSRHHRPVCRVAGRGAKQPVAIRCVIRRLSGIRSVPSACQALPVHRVAVRGGRRGGRSLPMPPARLCGFRVVGAICIYSFWKSPNI